MHAVGPRRGGDVGGSETNDAGHRREPGRIAAAGKNDRRVTEGTEGPGEDEGVIGDAAGRGRHIGAVEPDHAGTVVSSGSSAASPPASIRRMAASIPARTQK